MFQKMSYLLTGLLRKPKFFEGDFEITERRQADRIVFGSLPNQFVPTSCKAIRFDGSLFRV
jgi:hypothetical protein